MFHKTSHEEVPIGAKVVSDTYTETKIIVPVKIHGVGKSSVTVRVGKNFHTCHVGDTLNIEVDLDEARLVQS